MVEIQREDVAKVVEDVFRGLNPGVHIMQRTMLDALQPVIEAYAPFAARGQKVGKEIKAHARDIAEEMGFRSHGVWYSRVEDNYER